MRKVKFSVANSLDNFIARADGAVDCVLITLRQRLSEVRKACFYLTHLLRKRLKGDARLRGNG